MDDVGLGWAGAGGDDPHGLCQNPQSVSTMLETGLAHPFTRYFINSRQVPINFILLGLFTLFEGVSLGMVRNDKLVNN